MVRASFSKRVCSLLAKKRLRKTAVLTLLAFIAASTVSLLSLFLAVRLVPYSVAQSGMHELSTTILDRKGAPLRSYLSHDERWRIAADADKVSPWLVKATIATEDKRFWKHGGIDTIAVVRAFLSNLKRVRVVSGASTISMQVAGLEDKPKRNMSAKIQQAFHALQLERIMTKQQILSRYLTYAPYGGNICGVEAAARRYFGKSAATLSLSEAAMIAGIPQNPTRLRPDRQYANALRRRAHVLERMYACGYISSDDLKRIRDIHPRIGNYQTPVSAPHFCDLSHSLYPQAAALKTTLDTKLQQRLENLLRNHIKTLEPYGVTNGAAVLLDNRNGEVLALIGSVEYASTQNNGQVNGALAVRSPGSTLKPFIYARAFDKGSLVPSTLLFDVPNQYRGYEPENFDHTWQGLIRADKALAWSLNIPAIDTLQKVGVSSTVRVLRDCGMETLTESAGEYGLSLAVGTCGTRLLDLANGYATLARGGNYIPWTICRETTAGIPQRVFSRGACTLVNSILSDPELRPPENISLELTGMEGIAWKTGTSSGNRDALTFAYDGYYTVGVWAGNMNGKGVPAIVGSRAAAPVALSMMKYLHETYNGALQLHSDEISTGVLCLETGYAAADDCPTTRIGMVLANELSKTTALPECSIHKAIQVECATGEQMCARCMIGRKHERRVIACWPGTVIKWLREHDKTFSAAPRHFRECVTVAESAAPRIISPADGNHYVVTKSMPATFQLLQLEGSVIPPASHLYWFLNGELVQTASAAGGPLFITPPAGRNKLLCVDDMGRSHSISFTVEAD